MARSSQREEQPKVTDWMQAWGSVAAVFAGVAAAVAAGWLLLHERQEAQRARAELAAERAEAELTTPRAIVITDPMVIIDREYAEFKRMNFKVINYGPAAIRRVVAMAVLPPGKPEIYFEVTDFIAPAGGEHVFEQSYRYPLRLSEPDLVTSSTVQIALFFIDSSGQAWRKPKDGQPEKWFREFPLAPRTLE
ncbi:hypothetical protein [Micromonospora arida]|uniref:hypothetical protein n=1 Tax=Micromonospora arida TaxID=2203715 RepID=UPI0033F12948